MLGPAEMGQSRGAGESYGTAVGLTVLASSALLFFIPVLAPGWLSSGRNWPFGFETFPFVLFVAAVADRLAAVRRLPIANQRVLRHVSRLALCLAVVLTTCYLVWAGRF